MNIENRLKKLIAEQLNVSEDEVTPDARFVEDLGCDSLDLVELLVAVEDEFDIEIPDEEADKTKTVQGAIDYLVNKLDTVLQES